jgi:riboflavin synthase
MFTGIIEQMGTVTEITATGTNLSFWITAPMTGELKPDQSVAHNGVCLTVEVIEGERYRVTAIAETLAKTNLSDWRVGSVVNLERCMQLNGRLDGHIVQGHVDTTGICTSVQEKSGSWEYRFQFDRRFAPLCIEKGSITINGTSLTLFDVSDDGFSVAIIPYTYEHTNIHRLQVGDKVNLEFDLIGKYVNRLAQFK